MRRYPFLELVDRITLTLYCECTEPDKVISPKVGRRRYGAPYHGQQKPAHCVRPMAPDLPGPLTTQLFALIGPTG